MNHTGPVLSSKHENIENFERLLVDNAARLAGIARAYAPSHEFEDLLQNIHTQLWRSRNSFNGAAHINTWLYRVAMNTAISYARQRRLETEPLISPDEVVADASADDALHLLREFLRSLNGVNRSVLLMYLDGLNHDDIAAVLGSNSNAIAVRLNRIKRDFERRYVEDSA